MKNSKLIFANKGHLNLIILQSQFFTIDFEGGDDYHIEFAEAGFNTAEGNRIKRMSKMNDFRMSMSDDEYEMALEKFDDYNKFQDEIWERIEKEDKVKCVWINHVQRDLNEMIAECREYSINQTPFAHQDAQEKAEEMIEKTGMEATTPREIKIVREIECSARVIQYTERQLNRIKTQKDINELKDMQKKHLQRVDVLMTEFRAIKRGEQ